MSAEGLAVVMPPSGSVDGGPARPLMTSSAPTSVEREQQEPPRPPIRMHTPRLDVFDQDAARAHRLEGRPVWLRDFDLSVEVEAVCRPLAAEMAEILGPLVLRDRSDGRLAFHAEIDCVAVAVGELRESVLGLLAGDRSAGDDVRARLRAMVGVPVPGFDDDAILSGGWVDVLVGHVAALSGDLAALLDRDSESRSPVVVTGPAVEVFLALRVLDQAAQDFRRRFRPVRDRVRLLQEGPAFEAKFVAQREASRRAHELRKLGL